MCDLLKDKTVVITGCLKGIGRATLEVFANNKANIFACAQPPDEEFENFIEKLAVKNGIWITPVYFDLSDNESIKK
jgi:3-oxoacyl-[acyl-carrier protein] reductase